MTIPDEIQTALARLADAAGRLDAETVVRAARSKGHPLHAYFEWDDKKAAHEHRLAQANDLIRRVTIEITHHDVTLAIPAWVRDPSKRADESGHVQTLKLVGQEDLARQALLYAAQMAAGNLQRVRMLAIGFGLGHEVEEVLERFEAFRLLLEPAGGPDA